MSFVKLKCDESGDQWLIHIDDIQYVRSSGDYEAKNKGKYYTRVILKNGVEIGLRTPFSVINDRIQYVSDYGQSR